MIHLTLHARLLGAAFDLGLLALLVELVRRRSLQVRYTVVWTVAVLVLLVAVSVPASIALPARLLGIYDPTIALFTVFGIAALALILHLTVVVSRLSEQIVRLGQERALDQAERTALRPDEGAPRRAR